jgi:hypothetical protein
MSGAQLASSSLGGNLEENAMPRPETVVDYEAWRKGYMPPSEHVLIDQLAYRGARVIHGSDWGKFAIWVVMRGTIPNSKVRKAIWEMVHLALEDADNHHAPPYEYDSAWC